MFNWVLNRPLILSSNLIFHAYGSIGDTKFLGLVYHSYTFYVLTIRNELKKVLLQNVKKSCFKCKKLT